MFRKRAKITGVKSQRNRNLVYKIMRRDYIKSILHRNAYGATICRFLWASRQKEWNLS